MYISSYNDIGKIKAGNYLREISKNLSNDEVDEIYKIIRLIETKINNGNVIIGENYIDIEFKDYMIKYKSTIEIVLNVYGFTFHRTEYVHENEKFTLCFQYR